MKNIKGLLVAVIILLIGACSTAAPGVVNETAKVDVNVIALKGPTAMGLVKFMDDSDNGLITGNNYNFEILSAVDEVAPKIIKGEVQIAALPSNLASVIYNNSNGKIAVLAINTLGVLYICETGDSVKTIADLAGKTIYASGKGATPEYALNYILSSNGLEVGTDVFVEWKSEHAECVAAIVQDETAIAMLPQPFVSAAQSKNDKIKASLSLSEEWDKLNNGSSLVMGVVVARKDFIEENPEAVEEFLSNYEASIKFLNENNAEAATLIGKYEIVEEAVALKALPASNIVFITGNEMKEKLSGYLSVLFEQNPASVGGALPSDDFYYGAK